MTARTSGKDSPGLARVKLALLLLAGIVSVLGATDLATGSSAMASAAPMGAR